MNEFVRRTGCQNVLAFSISSLLGCCGSPSTLGASFQGLGDLPGGAFASVATSVSADGKVVAGYSASTNGYEAFRWTAWTGLKGLGELPGGTFASFANAISPDGTTIVGNSQSAFGDQAFGWTEATGISGLGDLPGSSFFSFATGVSSNGNVIVGFSASTLSGNNSEAFRWTPTNGMVGLGDLPGGSFKSRAWGVSADGTVIVGESSSANSGSNLEAFRWTGAGMSGLGDLVGGLFHSIAYAVSSDGNVIAGYGIPTSGFHAAFRWTATTGMIGLGTLPCDTWSIARATSGDGSIIVGDPQIVSGDCVFLWTQARGMRPLLEVLTNDYALNLAGWTLRAPTAVSQNGTVIVGHGINPGGQTEGWIADLTPSLGISRGSDHVVLSWSTNARGFALQQNLTTGSPNTWEEVPTSPALMNNRYVVTNNTDAVRTFFRLVKP
jgi:probable HAF family extracellular repeat protein